MKILLTHNYYQIAGGEDTVLGNEAELLLSKGHEVLEYTINNKKINTFLSKINAILNLPLSYSQYSNMLKKLDEEKPDIVHVHNYFPLFSPSIFYACKKAKVPVVHTLHNYRAVCPTALLMHNGEINETSVTGSAWWSVVKRVYRGSYLGSLAVYTMVELHKKMGTWRKKVDRFIALTEFSKQKYIEAGWPSNKITVKPNFIEDPFEHRVKLNDKGGYALYIGRLSEEKGIATLFKAWNHYQYPLKIIGDGPMKDTVIHHTNDFIDYLGRKEKIEILELIEKSDFVILPSICYETFGMVIIEAFACGTPVLVSKLGSLKVIVENKVTGLHFAPGNSTDLVEKVKWLVEHPKEVKQMGNNARKEYLDKYTPEKNYEILMDIYQQAIEEAKLS